MKINVPFIHDTKIYFVTEDSNKDELIFDIQWPKDWENNIFVSANLIFENVLNYQIHEGPFSGNPVILDILEIGKKTDFGIERVGFKIETNAGFRLLYCTDVKLYEK